MASYNVYIIRMHHVLVLWSYRSYKHKEIDDAKGERVREL